MEVMAMRCAVPVPSVISSMPFTACVIEVPRLYTAGLQNLVAQLLLSGVHVFIAGECADVKATVAALKATMAEDMYPGDVSIYNLSSKTPLYTSNSHVVSICSATAFDTRMPRYVASTEGPMSSVLPVEIFSYLWSMVPAPERAGNWFLLGLCLRILQAWCLPGFPRTVMLCVPFSVRRPHCLMSLFSPSVRLSPTPTPAPRSHGRMCTMTWEQVFLWIALVLGM